MTGALGKVLWHIVLPLVPTKAFACICVHIFFTIYQSGVLAQGALACICVHILCTIYERGVLAQEGGVVCGPKTSERADKNAVSV